MTTLSEDERLFRDSVYEFADREVRPLVREMDEHAKIADGLVAKLFDLGVMAIEIPEAFGGAGASFFHAVLAVEALSRVDPSVGVLVDVQNTLVINALLRWGTEAIKQRYLPKLASDTIGAYALSEAGSGSDAFAMTTRATERDNGDWSITGRKVFITNANEAGLFIVFATADPGGGYRGITAFLVERGTPGFSVTRVDTTIGSEAIKLAELTIDNCFLPDSAVLGEVGQGFRIAMESLTNGRLGVSCSCLGTADRLIEMSAAYAKERVTFGQPLSERQAIQWMLADSATELAMARAYTYETLRRVAAGEDVGTAASMCKLYCSEMVGRVADRAVQIHGGMGLVRGYPVERFYRDVRHYRVGEGSSEIQRMLIARDLLR